MIRAWSLQNNTQILTVTRVITHHLIYLDRRCCHLLIIQQVTTRRSTFHPKSMVCVDWVGKLQSNFRSHRCSQAKNTTRTWMTFLIPNQKRQFHFQSTIRARLWNRITNRIHIWTAKMLKKVQTWRDRCHCQSRLRVPRKIPISLSQSQRNVYASAMSTTFTLLNLEPKRRSQSPKKIHGCGQKLIILTRKYLTLTFDALSRGRPLWRIHRQ